MMNSDDLKNLLEIIGMLVLWIGSGAILWTKTTDKVNGLGVRVKKLENACSEQDGRMNRFERELSEYRRDAAEASRGIARVDKGVEDLNESINQSTLQLGAQLHALDKTITDRDTRTQVRLTRIETVAKIEEKIGPISTD